MGVSRGIEEKGNYEERKKERKKEREKEEQEEVTENDAFSRRFLLLMSKQKKL